MGRRSRKRIDPESRVAAGGGAGEAGGSATERARATSSRAERDAARRRRAARLGGRTGSPPERLPRRRATGERPPAPWGSFPLAEIVVALAIVLGVTGFFVLGPRGLAMIVAAGVLGSLVGAELALREHLAGYRSHTTVLAVAAAVAAMMSLVYATGYGTLAAPVVLGVGAAVFVPAFLLLWRAFRRRSGGLSFR
jgi:hypothetical protein